jgi:hypothetical protein
MRLVSSTPCHDTDDLVPRFVVEGGQHAFLQERRGIGFPDIVALLQHSPDPPQGLAETVIVAVQSCHVFLYLVLPDIVLDIVFTNIVFTNIVSDLVLPAIVLDIVSNIVLDIVLHIVFINIVLDVGPFGFSLDGRVGIVYNTQTRQGKVNQYEIIQEKKKKKKKKKGKGAQKYLECVCSHGCSTV